MSEGAFSFSSIFSAEEENTEKGAGSDVPCVGADPWGAGRDLPSLLQQVSLKGRRVSGDMSSVPRRRLDLFSSLRLRKKRQGPESEEIDQDHSYQSAEQRCAFYSL